MTMLEMNAISRTSGDHLRNHDLSAPLINIPFVDLQTERQQSARSPLQLDTERHRDLVRHSFLTANSIG
tara:strand:- start:3284 stop:3490 length:207 start_codon:yes stop_codon:yes gene_type:complete